MWSSLLHLSNFPGGLAQEEERRRFGISRDWCMYRNQCFWRLERDQLFWLNIVRSKPDGNLQKITRKSTHRCASLTGIIGLTWLTGINGITWLTGNPKNIPYWLTDNLNSRDASASKNIARGTTNPGIEFFCFCECFYLIYKLNFNFGS